MFLTLLRITIFCLVLLGLATCTDSSSERQNSIIELVQLEKINDATYYFPANMDVDSATEYLPLKRWDIIFTGAIVPDPNRPELTAIDRLIPGYFNHILVYIGKDSDGYAYAVEINVDNIEFVDSQLLVDGGVKLLAISKDYGEEPHKSGAHVIDRNYYQVRWAKTYRPDVREKLISKDVELIQNIRDHFNNNFPYQLEFTIPSRLELLFDQKVKLIDDGLKDGAGCGDYWSSLFEDIAEICFYDTRMNGAELVNYYSNDAIGREAFLPPQWNPIGDETLYIYELLEMGFYVEEDEPHEFSCDGSQESGVVLPAKIYESELLEDIVY